MTKKPKVLLIGWDAADWKLIGPLLAKGQMPSLKRLIDTGVYGNMSTLNPPYSPMLWTSVATGKMPDKHGILGFIEPTPDMKSIRPVTVSSRETRALWNIFHNQGLKSNLISWWPSFPAEPINGVVVTDKFQKLKKEQKHPPPLSEASVWPKSIKDTLDALRIGGSDITENHILPFIPNAHRIDQKSSKFLMSFTKILAENVNTHAAATHTLRTTNWDFTAIYYDLIDHMCHAFMKFHPPKLGGIPEHLFDIYNEVILNTYKFQDMMLGRTLDLIDDDTTVIVMSDHGYESGHKRILKMPKYPAAPALEHRQFGIFVASGPGIKRNEKVFGLGLIDVTPTILHMFNLPIGKDMDGKIALDIFETPKAPDYIDSWDLVKGDFGEAIKDPHNDDTRSDSAALEQLIALGYIEKPDEDLGVTVRKTQCDIKHNLARVYKGKKDYAQAKQLLLELVEEKPPVDVIPYYLDLLSLSFSENDYENAEYYLNELKQRNTSFEINTYFSEAKILIHKGQTNAALQMLKRAKDNSPNGEVWFEIGKIELQLELYLRAQYAFEQALSFEIDNARYQHALAKTFLHLANYETAADHALTAIELIKYFPEAHYTLGVALEKLGHEEAAKNAYEMAAKLKPKTHYRAEKALENIRNLKANLNNKYDGVYVKNQITIVSGLPRSGTSLMMQMLDKGGLEILTDHKRKADTSNPKGYYEYEPVMTIHKDNQWLHKAQDKGLKVVAPLLKHLDPKYRYKIIFMNRDLTEIIKSQQTMIGKNKDILPVSLLEAYQKQLTNVDTWKANEPNVELLYVNYSDLFNNASDITKHINTFLGTSLNTANMMATIDPKLYRNKS
ncbi:MAG: alkaline phosphatase family protein [Flavobacteriaceae bacterium]|nr:alkaline phosphatase family protein [Flavobacteriaceae bacterium]